MKAQFEYLTITRVPVSMIQKNTGQIKDLPANPREWTEDDLHLLAKSLQETPELFNARPVLLFPHEEIFVALGGNFRFEAAVFLKWETVPAYIYPPDTPVEKLKEIVIKDNGSFGKWEFKLLKQEWGDLPLGQWGVVGWGADEEGPAAQEETAKEDDFDESRDAVKTICKEGDIWGLGEHRLLCGDSTDPDEIKTLMGGGMADLWLTDPPYNVNVENADKMKIKNDNMRDSDFREFLLKAFVAAEMALRPGAACYVWMASTEIDAAIEQYEKAGLLYKQLLIWVKNAFTLGRQDYQWRHESCIYGWKPGAHYFIDSRRETTVREDRPEIEKMTKAQAKELLKTIFDEQGIATTAFRYDKPVKDAEHPTMKPVPMIGYQIRNSSRRGDIVLDTFGGSGTTLIACEQMGRKCRMMELDPHYCDVIIARWEKLTGLKAEKLN